MDRYDGFRELDRQECLRLLSLVPIGRIVYTDDALPAVLPVDFFLDRDHSVVVRTSAGSRMAHAVDGAVVAFQADRFDDAAHTGWSVIVTGRATLVTDARDKEQLHAAGLRAWAAVPEDVFIRISLELVTGCVLRGHRQGGGERGTPPLAGVQ
ncbi:pyridoxamine 5'-phosphate oxidase family protein [Streptomyces sp. NPDC001339]|uniref:pyridoxamine 5'-phosphate oxidase family protein n=1 Tax=Streptomyces sp. NPDC001339 TaxID=3364563 RepID=UPI0036B25B99